ncbi:MAG TPA: efflux transporter outer membrane subunit, partial [Steroidobacteraceae bacterium]|nr:efflux transporter outer membrane subunit [Steroidobacteraceae bacterium]
SSPLRVALAGTLALAGCAAIPPGKPPAAALAPDTLAPSAAMTAAATGHWPEQLWWTRFRDPQLDRLMQRALAGNPRLATAQARIDEARGLAKVSGSATLPSVEAEAGSALTRFTHDSYIPPEINGHDLFDRPVWVSDIGVSAAYHLDFWGRDRAALEASLDRVKVAEYEAQDARLALEDALLRSYAQLSYAYEIQDNERGILSDEQQTLDLANRRLKAGLGTELEIEEAKSAVAATQGELTQIEDRMALLQHQIAALCGDGPGSAEGLARPALTVSHEPATLPSRIPAELIGRRPDVLAERYRVESAGKQIEVAKAAFYPNVDLKATVGLLGIGFGQLVSLKAINADAGPAVTLPIFEGGKLEGALDVRRAQYDAAVDAYNATVLQALREVADELSRHDSLEALQKRRAERLAYARRAHELARIAFRAGLTDYLNVLTTQNDLNRAQNQLAQVGLQQLISLAALNQALGGGLVQ